jgi:hypothetical protein
MRDGYLRGSLPGTPTARQVEVLAAFVAAGGSVRDAAAYVGVRPSNAKRHLADLRGAPPASPPSSSSTGDGRRDGW